MAEIIFHKALKGSFIPDWVIGLRTLSRYSHVELRFSDHEVFSASWFDGRGVRWKSGFELDPETWTRYAIVADFDKIKQLRDWCYDLDVDRKLNGTGGYDLWSVLRWGSQTDNLDKWFCSEVCFQGLVKANILPDERQFRKISPGSGEKYCSHHQMRSDEESTFAWIHPEQKRFFTDQEGDELWRRLHGV